MKKIYEFYGQEEFVRRLSLLLGNIGDSIKQRDEGVPIKLGEVFHQGFEIAFGSPLTKDDLELFVKHGKIPAVNAEKVS